MTTSQWEQYLEAYILFVRYIMLFCCSLTPVLTQISPVMYISRIMHMYEKY